MAERARSRCEVVETDAIVEWGSDVRGVMRSSEVVGW
jgi:hypothetical protein